MANSYFQFKQFRIDQGQCAMKVTTDACLLGGYVAQEQVAQQHILDIGAGTGLLSLMLAQATTVAIDAVELDEQAAIQCQENFRQSPWAERLTLFQSAVQDFASTTQNRYDLIISNPPYFPNHIKNKNAIKSQARHTDTLSFADLVRSVQQLLMENGCFYLILPTYEHQLFHHEAEQQGLFCQKQIHIRDRQDTAVIRVIGKYGKELPEAIAIEEFIIKQDKATYTAAFIALLKAYYLYL